MKIVLAVYRHTSADEERQLTMVEQCVMMKRMLEKERLYQRTNIFDICSFNNEDLSFLSERTKERRTSMINRENDSIQSILPAINTWKYPSKINREERKTANLIHWSMEKKGRETFVKRCHCRRKYLLFSLENVFITTNDGIKSSLKVTTEKREKRSSRKRFSTTIDNVTI